MDNLEYLLEPNFQVMDDNGKPLVGGWIEVYLHNTTTKVITYCDFDGTQNEFKVVLNSLGMANIIVEADSLYDVYCYDSFGALRWSRMNVSKVDLFPLKVYTEGDLENPVAEYDPTDGQGEGFVQKKLTIKVNGQTEAEYVPFAEEGEEVDIHSESVEWDAGSHSIKKDVNGTKETIVEVENTYSPTSEKPISGKGVAECLSEEKFVSVKSQSWSDAQKEQARSNINSVGGGDFLPKDSNIFQRVSGIFWNGKTGSLIVEGHVGAYEGGTLAPLAKGDGSDKGKIPFVELFSGSYYNLVYRFILENCDTNAKVIEAVQNGQIPYHTGSAGKYLPYIIADNGVMYLYNIFGVLDNNPMTGDALGLSLRKKVYNGNVIDECFWGKPYGINNFKLVEYSANDDYGFNIASKKMVWRRIPFDRELTITKFAIVTNRDNHNVVQPTYMVGIFDFDGANVINVSESSTWTYGNMEGFSDTESVACIDDMQSYYGFGDYYIVEFTLSQPLVLQRGGNYLFPCYCNDAVKNGSPTIIAYKSASPALPWEELWANTTESGNPSPSTSKTGCKASALRLTLSDGTEMWI